MVARAGVQPATFALGVRCSMQLSYRATASSVSRAANSKDNGLNAEDAKAAQRPQRETAVVRGRILVWLSTPSSCRFITRKRTLPSSTIA